MNILLWVLQGLAALMYGASGVMKVFMFDKVSADVQSFGALPRQVWTTLGIIELVENPNSSAQDLNELIGRDPALSARVLKVVNSAFYGLPRQIGSITRGGSACRSTRWSRLSRRCRAAVRSRSISPAMRCGAAIGLRSRPTT